MPYRALVSYGEQLALKFSTTPNARPPTKSTTGQCFLFSPPLTETGRYSRGERHAANPGGRAGDFEGQHRIA